MMPSLAVSTCMEMHMVQVVYCCRFLFEEKSASGRNSLVWKILCGVSGLGTSKRLATGSPDPYPD